MKKAATTSGREKNVRWKMFGKGFLLLCFTFAAYGPAVQNGFIWDDDVMLTDNAVMREPDGLGRIWFSTELSDYFPLTSTSFWIEWRLWGMNPTGYNITNILLHALSGIALWRVLLRLKFKGSWLAALLFVVHPVCVASVDWIAERKNVLSMVFYLSSLLLYLRFEDEQRRKWYTLSLIAFLLALLSKTSVVVLPLVLLLCHWWKENKVTGRALRQTVPFFALALLMGGVTVWFQLHEVLLGEAKETDTMLTRLLGGSWAVWFYLGKILWPARLSMIYAQWDIDEASWLSYLPGVLWISVLALCWYRRERSWGRGALFGLGYFTIALLPVLGFFDMNFLLFSQVADHLQYIAIPGIVALAVTAFRRLWIEAKRRFPTLAQAWPEQIIPVFSAGIAVLLLAILTWRQSLTYTDEETLWRDTIVKTPTAWIGYHNLADRLAELRRYKEAAMYYEEALRLKPDHALSHNNLGNALHLLGKLDEATDQFLDAIQNKPELAEAHYNLAYTLYAKHEYAKALVEYREAVRTKPSYGVAHLGAGNCQLQLGDLSGALNTYFTAQRYIPQDPDLQYNIGIILSVTGETNGAVRFLQHALRLNPHHQLAEKELKLLLANTDAPP